MTKLFLAVGILLSMTAAATARDLAVDANTMAVKNVYDPILRNYQVTIQENCPNPGLCVDDAPVLDQDTLIQHVSCQFIISTSGHVTFAYLGESGETSTNYVPYFAYATVDDQIYRGINADTFLLYKKGVAPLMQIYTKDAGPGLVTCTLSGYHK